MWGINCRQTVSGIVVICVYNFQMKRKERYDTVIDHFQVNIPEAETELLYDNPFQLLVAVILSAQCTDKRVNLTTPAIFERFPDPRLQTLAFGRFALGHPDGPC